MLRRVPLLAVLAIASIAVLARPTTDEAGGDRRVDPRQAALLRSGEERYTAYVRAERASLRERQGAGDAEGTRIHAARVAPAERAGTTEPIAVARAAAEVLSGDARAIGRGALLDVESHAAGAGAAFDAIRDATWARDKGLVGSIDERLANLRSELDRHRRGDGFRPARSVTTADRRRLAAALDALAWRLALAASRLAGRPA